MSPNQGDDRGCTRARWRRRRQVCRRIWCDSPVKQALELRLNLLREADGVGWFSKPDEPFRNVHQGLAMRGLFLDTGSDT